MKKVLLKGKIGGTAIVDDEDFEFVSRLTWWADKHKTGIYAYAQIPWGGKVRTVRMHQLILPVPAGFEVDHRDGNGLNNRRRNLRKATSQQQKWNSRSKRNRQHKGITVQKRLKKNPFQARIFLDGRLMHLGYFPTMETAAAAYNAAAKKAHGEFVKISKVECVK